MAILMCSLLFTGCSERQEFHYEYGEGDSGEEILDDDSLLIDTEYSISEELSGSTIESGDVLVNDDIIVTVADTRYTKFVYRVLSTKTGVVTGDIIFTFADGKISSTHVLAMDLSKQYQFITDLQTGNIIKVDVNLKRIDEKLTEQREFGDKLERLSANTFGCNKSGVYALYDEKSVVVDTIEMKKGEMYVTVFGVKYYSTIE